MSIADSLDLGGALNLSGMKDTTSLLNLSGMKEASGGVLELCVVCGDRASGMYLFCSFFIFWRKPLKTSLLRNVIFLRFAVFVLKMHECCFRLVGRWPNWCNFPSTG